MNDALINALWLLGYVGMVWVPSPSFQTYYLNPEHRAKLEASNKFKSLTADEKTWLKMVGHDLGAMVDHE